MEHMELQTRVEAGVPVVSNLADMVLVETVEVE
jgi:hypothetical protein